MKRLCVFLLITLSFSFIRAQDTTKTNMADTTSNYSLLQIVNTWSDDDYDLMLDSLKKYHTTDFFKLRMSYTKTSDYDPYSTDESKALKKADEYLGAGNYKKALSVLEDILEDNYVHIQAHLMSAFAYYKLQDTVNENYHQSICAGLIESILMSGDGKNSETAYIVIDTDEEYDFLGAFNLSRGIQSLAHTDNHSFDIMETKKEGSDEKFDIYFNIDLPMKHMESIFK